jgi:probable rRNA maturation factor
MIKINVITHNINWLRFIKKPNSYIDKRIRKINSKIKKDFKNNIFCTLLLSNDKEIKILNKKFRNKDKSTDVLSFPFHKRSILKSILKKEKEVYLGDIIINLNKINEKKELKNFKKEFDQLWIHGLVHLFGYDHKKKNDFLNMSKVEKKYINFIYY